MNLRRLSAEFIGTFALVLVICMTTYAKVSADLQPVAIGLLLIGMIYANGYMSAALFNPAVTLAFWLRGRMETKDALAYIVVQFAAGATAAALTMFLTSAKPIIQPLVAPPQYFAVIPALLAEIVGAFLMCWVILNVATSKTLEGNNFYGLAIGTTVTGLIYALGSVSGSVFNPAVAIGVDVAQIGNWSNIWINMVGTFGGAALAALAFRFINKDE